MQKAVEVWTSGLHRLDSETSSLHDQIFHLFLNEFIDGSILTQLPDPDFQWKESTFCDGAFILVEGAVKILDYRHIAASIEKAMEYGKLIDRINRNSSANNSTIFQNLKKSNAPEVQKFIESSIQDTLRMRIYPDLSAPENVFVASAEEMFFRRSTATLNHEYGPIVDANWKSLLQVNTGSHHADTVPLILRVWAWGKSKLLWT